MFKRALIAAGLGLCLAAQFVPMAHAQTAAGSVIRNQAEATYFDPALDRSFRVDSTIATVRVSSAPDFVLLTDNDRVASADETVFFPHQLSNTGNEADSYALSYSQDDAASALVDVAIYLDENENGLLDDGEPEVTETEILQPGDTIALLLAGRVPSTAVPGTTFVSRIAATSELDPENTQTRTDTVRLEASLPFEISKQAFPACASPLQPGGVIDYSINLLNVDQLRQNAQVYQIDGQSVRGFVIEDMIPANTMLVADADVRVAPDFSVAIVKPAGAPSGAYSSYTNYREGDIIQSFGVFIPETVMAKGQSGGFDFQVRINDIITPGTVITNAVAVDLDTDGRADITSNSTCNTVDTNGVEASLRFLEPSLDVRRALSGSAKTGLIDGPRHPVDSDYADAPIYRLDSFPGYDLIRDGVYLEVQSNALNTTSFVQETQFGQRFIRVEVQAQSTGDKLFVRVDETGLNTGIFRARVPFRLSRTDAGSGRDCGVGLEDQCVLRSLGGDRLRATIFDPGTKAALADSAVVDPMGIVFDSTTLDPVAGAEIVILTETGARATDPDTGVILPVQLTDADGEYTIPRLTDGRYSLSVTAPDLYAFPSVVAPETFAGRRTVVDASYGLGGYNGSGQGFFETSFADAPAQIDIPLDPDLTLGQLRLEKTTVTQVAGIGETLVYEIEIQNASEAALLNIDIVDTPPAGFRFIEGSARLNDAPLNVVRGPQPRDLTFQIARLDPGSTASLRYTLQVGPEARPGDAENTAFATGETGGGLVATSAIARASVKVRDDGLMSDRAYIIGSVWADANGDGVRGEDEIGLPGARIWLEDGTWVETDELGRYSLYGLKPGLRIARLDETTLPDGYRVKMRKSRQALQGKARFVDLVAGDMHRADFPLACPVSCGRDSEFADISGKRAARLSPDAILDQALAYEGLIGETRGVLNNRLREQPGADGDVSNGVIGYAGAPGLAESQARELFAEDASPREFAAREGDVSEAVSDVKSGSDEPSLNPEIMAAKLGRIDVKEGAWLWPLPDAQTGVTYARDGRFMAAVRSGIAPTLYVDGEPVGSENLGALVENAEQGATVAAWYGVTLDAGRHQIEVRGLDMFGNTRVLAQTEVIVAGQVHKLIIEQPEERVAADGFSTAQLVIRAVDKAGTPASGTQFVTVDASIPGSAVPIKILGEDLQPDTQGHQVRLRNGSAIVEIVAPETQSEVTVKVVDAAERRAEQRVRFTGTVRDLMAVGLVDIVGRGFNVAGDLEPADEDLYPTKMDVDGRAAFFLKGQIKGDALLTLSYDSEASRQDGLFRDIDPEAYYPIYGDASAKGYEAQSRSKLYVRLEKGDSSIMWGDFRTDVNGVESLSRTRKSLTGVNAVSRHDEWTLGAFAAEVSRQQRSERIRGRGLALDITLPGAPLVRGSEVLTIEVRDRNNPGLLVSEETLSRFGDYLLDEETGRLTMKRPIPSIDELGNPVYLLATYEVDSGDADAIVAGVRADRTTETGTVWAGVTYDEAKTDVERMIYGSVGAERVFEGGRVYGEVGLSETKDDLDQTSMGEAFRFGAEALILDGQLTAEFAQADDAFANADAPIFAGRREARATYQRALDKQSTLAVGSTYSETLDSGDVRTTIDALFNRQMDGWSLTAGPRYTRLDNGEDVDYASALIRADKPFEFNGRAGSSSIEVERAFDQNSTRITLGGDYQLRDDTRFYASHRILDQLPQQTFAPGLTGNQQDVGLSQTVFGIETSFLPNTDVYGEWREAGALDAGQGEAAYGLRSLWDIEEGLSISPQFEWVHTFDDGNSPEDSAIAAGDAMALSFAVADRRYENSRRSGRFEGRVNPRSTFFASRIAWAERFTPVITGAAKFDIARDNIDGAEDSENLRFTLGAAYRPADADKTDMFALVQQLSEKEQGIRRNASLFSAHANRQFGEDWTASGRIAAKWEETGGINQSAQLVGTRLIWDAAPKWDAEVRGALRAVDWGAAYERSFGVAASYQPRSDIRLTLGYNFTGFDDRDLDPGGYDAQGVYWRIAIALDEDWFGWLRPDGQDIKTDAAPVRQIPVTQPVISATVADPVKPSVKATEVISSQLKPTPPVRPTTRIICGGTREVDIYFELDEAALSAAAMAKIDEVAAMAKCAKDPVRIVAHTDRSGPANYNQRLSARRAASVLAALKVRGVDVSQIEAVGKGEINPPIATKDGVTEPRNRVAKVTVLLK